MSDEKTQTPVPPPAIPNYAASPAATGQPGPVDDTPAQDVAPVDDKDVSMTDAPTVLEQAPSPAPAAAPTSTPTPTAATTTSGPAANAPSPAPARTGTPLRTNGQESSNSRAASQHPDPGAPSMPSTAAAHGAPVRQYLNANVTGVLVEGMKLIARDQPQDPLRVLGEFLINASKQQDPTA